MLVVAALLIAVVAGFVFIRTRGDSDPTPGFELPDVAVNIEPAGLAMVEEVAAALPQLSGDTDRDQIESFLGPPDAFVISFERRGENADGPFVRHELWYYYDFGTVYQFADGDYIADFPSTPPPGPTILPPRRYDPSFFRHGTALSEIAGLLSDPASFEEVPVEEAYAVPLTFYAGEQLLVGFDDEGLCYVETVPLSTDEEEEG